MKGISHFMRTICVLTALVLLLGAAPAARAASGGAYSDISGHWAEEYLRRAVAEKVMDGYGDGRLHPNDDATYAQTVALICRVIAPDEVTGGTSGSRWYEAYIELAEALGLPIEPARLRASGITRAEAFLMIADAFGLTLAEPDYSVLERFSDSGALTGRERAACASLISAKYVEGDRGRLYPSSALTRAELLALIYRIAENTSSGSSLPPEFSGGAVISGSGGISGRTFTDTVWLSGSAVGCDISGVEAGSLVFRSRRSSLTSDSKTKVGRLVIAGGSGGTLALSSGEYGTVAVASGAPKSVSISVPVRRIEVTGSGISVKINSSVDELVISGTGCTVTVPYGVRVGSIRLTELAEDNSLSLFCGCDELVLDGVSNKVSISSTVSEASLGGKGCSLTGSGYVGRLKVLTTRSTYSVSFGSKSESIPDGVKDAYIILQAPESLPVGETLTVEAAVRNPERLVCSYSWSVDGKVVERGTAEIGPAAISLSFKYNYTYSESMSQRSVVTLAVSYGPADGVADTVSESVSVLIENYQKYDLDNVTASIKAPKSVDAGNKLTASAAVESPYELSCLASWYIGERCVKTEDVTLHQGETVLKLTCKPSYTERVSSGDKLTLTLKSKPLHGKADSMSVTASVAFDKTTVTASEALSQVSSGYAGDYTLDWALDHDYDEDVKTVWVNAKGYTSRTDYLVWVNLTYQRVNVFKGSAGEWELLKTFMCGTGSSGRGTPAGEYYIFGHQPNGWTTSTYTVRPVVNFKVGSGYAFHSRLYDPSFDHLTDPSIGYPCSHGCVRMYDEDLQWIYDKIPIYTTVVVY